MNLHVKSGTASIIVRVSPEVAKVGHTPPDSIVTQVGLKEMVQMLAYLRAPLQVSIHWQMSPNRHQLIKPLLLML
jgi:hypothetical protein